MNDKLEGKYRILFEQANDSIFITDSQTRRILDANENAARRLGYTREELLELTVDDIVSKQAAPITNRAFAVLSNTDSLTFETVHRRKDGGDVPVEISTRIVEYGGRRVLQASVRDISKRKQAEELFSAMANSSPIGIFIVQDGRFKFVNPQVLKFSGFDESEILDAESLRLVFPDDRELVKKNAARMLKGESTTPYEYRLLTKSGDIHWMIETVAPIQFRGRRAAVGNFMDVTERKRLDEALQQALERKARTQSLLLALSQAAQAVQRVSASKEIYETVLEHVANIGYRAAILTLTDNITQLTISHVNFERSDLQLVKDMAGISVQHYRWPVVPGSFWGRVADGETVFSESLTEAIAEALPLAARPRAKMVAELLGFSRGVVTPLMSGGSASGVLVVSGPDLTEDDVPSVCAFGNHIAIASEKALLFQKTLELAITDGLTELYNHRYFHELLEVEAKRARRYERSMALLMVDIDHFKEINDSYGHQAGDEVLRALAGTLKAAVRDTDHVARYGGEEFAIILPETEGTEAARLAERIRRTVEEQEFAVESQRIRMTVSVGAASFNAQEETTDGLVRKADRALYRAKYEGRNCVRV